MSKSTQVAGLQGQVINLMSNDFNKADMGLFFLHDLWKGPIEVFVLGYLIYREIGAAGFVGIAFILSLIPVQCEIEVVVSKQVIKKIFCSQHSSVKCQQLSEKGRLKGRTSECN
jgi:hypothetical protein